MSNRIKNILKKIDSFAPDPWIIDGRVQSRPLNQLIAFVITVPILIILFFFIF